MSKLPYLACIAVLLLLGAKSQNEMFAKYKQVEAYEIRPGVLAMPRYNADGEVCEIGFEKPSYSQGSLDIQLSFTQKEIDEIVDEFAPPDVKGTKSKEWWNGMMDVSGQAYVTTTTYENITISTAGGITPTFHRNFVGHQSVHWASTGDVAFTITWTKRKCQ